MKYDVTAYTPLSPHGEYRTLGVVEAPDRNRAFEEGLRRWPLVPAHRLFVKPQEEAQVPPGGPTGPEEDN